jgi:PAS domain S-box-containing protein
MNNHDDWIANAAELRRRAHQLAREKAAQSSEDLEALSPEEARKLVHELQVHQIELEMQNEELRRTQEELEALRERYFDIYDLAPVGYLISSGKGTILEVNLTAALLLNAARDELVGQPVARFISFDDQDVFYHHSKQLAKPGVKRSCEFRLRCNEHAPVWMRMDSISIQDAHGESVCRAVLIDITERKRAEAALSDARRRLENIIECAHIGTWEWNIQTGEAIINEAWAQIAGYKLEELSPISIKTWERLVHPEDQKRSAAALERHFAGELPRYDIECRMRHKDGHWIWIRVIGRVLTCGSDGKPLMMLGTHIDITQRKQAAEEREILDTRNRQLQKSESLGRMAGAIAHHFNNQLLGVMMNLDFARRCRCGDETQAEYLTEATRSARKAAEISSMMLTYLGQSFAKRKPMDLSDTCRQSLPMLRAVLPPSVALEANLPIPGPVISANKNQLQQVLASLITNASEAIGDGQGLIRLSVKTVSATAVPEANRFPIGLKIQDNVYGCLEVADSGCGIRSQDIENLFDPFFSSKFTGRGLGLAVVLGILQTHKGFVAVESDLGRGSVFRVFLPLSPEALLLENAPAPQAPKPPEGGTVLVVDDEQSLRHVLITAIEGMGFKVLEAQDGVEAVEVFRLHQDQIRLVLCDLTMPRMDGWETLAALRKLAPGIPVILSSGYDEGQVMAASHPDRPQAFLSKPYEYGILMETIFQVLGKAAE